MHMNSNEFLLSIYTVIINLLIFNIIYIAEFSLGALHKPRAWPQTITIGKKKSLLNPWTGPFRYGGRPLLMEGLKMEEEVR